MLSFVASDLFPGARGLILAAISAAAMSTLSSSVNSSASSLLDDLLGSWTSRQSDRTALWTARATTLLFTVAQAAVAFMGAQVIRGNQVVVNKVLAIAGFAAGLLLGLYFLGLLVGRAPSWLAILSLAAGASVSFTVLYLGWHWLWYPVVGSLSTLACGLVLMSILAPLSVSTPKGPPHD